MQMENIVAAAAKFPSLSAPIKLERIQIQMSLARRADFNEGRRHCEGGYRNSENITKYKKKGEKGAIERGERRTAGGGGRVAQGEKKEGAGGKKRAERRGIDGTEKMDRKSGRR